MELSFQIKPIRLGLLIFSFLSVVSGLSLPAEARTLVITHADPMYDPTSLSGPRIRQLLEDPQFKRKIVLSGTKRQNRFTFDPTGLNFEEKYSKSGEIAWDDSDDEIVVAGGYVANCLLQTIADLIARSKRNIRIEVDMEGSFDTHSLVLNDPLLQFSTEPLATLNVIENKFGVDRLMSGLQGYFSYEFAYYKPNAHVDLQLHGQQAKVIGEGLRRVRVNFASAKDICNSNLETKVKNAKK